MPTTAEATARPGQKSAKSLKGAGSLASGAALMAAAGLALSLNAVSSDAMIAQGFDRAFATLAASQSPAAHIAPAFDGLAGSEDDWLRSSSNHEIVKVVSIGQQIRIQDKGAERQLVITGVRDGGDAETHIDTSSSSPRVQLITCRDDSEPQGREIRLRLEGGRISEVAADPVARAL